MSKQEQKDEAFEIYQEAIVPAEKIYQEAIAPAKKIYQKEKAPAEKNFQEATDPFWKTYQEKCNEINNQEAEQEDETIKIIDGKKYQLIK